MDNYDVPDVVSSFLATDPIKPYHIVDSILPYKEIKKRAEKMTKSTIIDRKLDFDDFNDNIFEDKIKEKSMRKTLAN